ncbi:MAG: hypothetical protein LBR12_01595, partial [Opitutaceae bacterium]|nr:hypothetical protein [Opitutaceae bacterium]
MRRMAAACRAAACRVTAACLAATCCAAALADDAVVRLDEVVVSGWVANAAPAEGVATLASELRFEPQVDAQARGFAEGQADIAIRGGTFESSGLVLAGLPVFDAQTGHYLLEMPVSPRFLGAATVRTGAELSLGGWNAIAGAVARDFAAVRDGGVVAAGAGGHRAMRGEIVLGASDLGSVAGLKVGADIEAGWSEGDGSRARGDYELGRVGARVRLLGTDSKLGTGSNGGSGAGSRTDFFAGYQRKFIGWINLYAAPYGSAETDELRTSLAMVSHSGERGGLSWRAGAYWRRNDDVYQFNRDKPSNAYVHTTDIVGASAELAAQVRGETAAEASRLLLRAGVIGDSIESSSLKHGRYNSRTQGFAGAFW